MRIINGLSWNGEKKKIPKRVTIYGPPRDTCSYPGCQWAYEPAELCENKKAFLIDADAERSGHRRKQKTAEGDEGDAGDAGRRKRRTEGPVPGEFLERFVRNFG